MVRTVVQLTDEQFTALKSLSARQRRPLADLLRQGVDWVLAQGGAPSSDAKRRALAASGRFRSGLGDLARHHDRYLGKLDQ